MCGILGFNWTDNTLLKKMQESMKHRGPDQRGQFADSNISLGHVRLSIIDLSEKGRQPMSNEDGTVWIVFNGEIYNFQEIRVSLEAKGHIFRSNSDTETIIHAYEEYGIRCLEALNGMFAFAIYDMRKNILVIARDRFGVKPLYYHFQNGRFSFASEMKALLLTGIQKELNMSALDSFLACRYEFMRETMITGIFKLMPGNLLIFDIKAKTLSRRTYWSPCFKPLARPEGMLKAELDRLLHDSIERQMISDVPLGVFLSGGIDSSAIVAYMDRIRKEKDLGETKTFSVGFNLEKDYDDMVYAKDVSNLYNTDHHEIFLDASIVNELPKVIWQMDSPVSAPDAIPTYIMSREARKRVKVALTGNGADELFGGYEHYKFLMYLKHFRKMPNSVVQKSLPLVIRNLPNRLISKFFKFPAKMGQKGIERAIKTVELTKNEAASYISLISIFDDDERRDIMACAKPEMDRRIKNTQSEIGKYFTKDDTPLNKILRRELVHFMPECVLHVADRTSMAASLEARVPFLDNHLANFSFKLKDNMKLRGLSEKYILKKTVRSMLPRSVIYRTKQGFHVPIDIWLKDELKYLAEDLLAPHRLKKQGLFKPDTLAKISTHLKDSNMYSARQLWCLLSYQIWHEMIFNDVDVKALTRKIRY